MLKTKRKNHKKSITFSYAILFITSLQFFIYALCITGGYSHQHFFIRENLNVQQISVQQLHSNDYLLSSNFQQLQFLYRLALSEHSFSVWRHASFEREKTLREAALNPSALRKALSLSRTAQRLALSSTTYDSDLGEADEEASITPNFETPVHVSNNSLVFSSY